MSANENKRVVQDMFAELAAGNSKPFVDSFADDIQWTLIGSTEWSGTFRGKQSVLTELLGPLRAQLAERLTVTTHRFIADGDYVVVEARGRAMTKAGQPYNNSYCWIYRLADGKVQEVTEYMDTQLVAEALGSPQRQAG
jgi:uncharacterized protein